MKRGDVGGGIEKPKKSQLAKEIWFNFDVLGGNCLMYIQMWLETFTTPP